VKSWIILLAAVLLSPLLRAAEKPNILVIIADDCTYSELPFHGGQNAQTPNLDAFVKQGTVFDRAYLGMAMCSPCRSEFYTGRLPLRNGCAWNQGTSRPGTKSITHYLGDLGYRVGLAGKTHIKPRGVFSFEDVPGFDENCVREPTRPHHVEGARKFITRDDKQPFCLVVALTEPHAPWVMGDASAYPPKSLKMPAYLADTPLTRQSFSHYLAEITYMDGQVGDLLGMLDKTGKAKDTLVIFTSEQGGQFPGCKWTNWDLGLHTSVVARWPGVVPAGRRTPALIQYADMVPTFIELAGGQPEARDFDGTSFAAVLRGEKDTHREFVEGMHNNYPEGPPYPIRSISDGEWRYIRNLTPERMYIEKHLMGRTEHNPYWGSWVFSATENPRNLMLVERFTHRPAEELYHTAQDRVEQKNLANDPAAAEVKGRLSAALDRYLKDQLDPGAVLDTRAAFEAAQDLKPTFPGKE
jgi:N-sulfoglucosamine sulfohydrolase